MELPRFSHAAKCLAEAATLLSTAAQAMAVAAQAFSSAGSDLEKIHCSHTGSLESSRNATDFKANSQHQNLTAERTGYDNPGTSTHTPTNPKALKNYTQGYCSSSDSDYYMSDEDEGYITALLRRQREKDFDGPGPATFPKQLESIPPTPLQPAPSSPSSILSGPQLSFAGETSPNETISSRFQRRILVNLETDVIPVACALTQTYNKVICYMHCALPSIMMYQKIIKSATESLVYVVAKPADLDRTCKAVDRQTKAILLLPETIYSDVVVEGKDDLCLIHVGWPYSAERYRSQIRLHDAPYSVLVAYVGDQAMYPSCQEILNLTEPWPDNEMDMYENRRHNLSLKIQSALLEIPRTLKEQFYLDWIEVHGPNGQRQVSLWTPTVLVHRANLYILDVLRYHAHDPDLAQSQCLFPPVPEEFVSQNGLEPAVKKGILNLVESGSGLNHSSTLPGEVKSNKSQPQQDSILTEGLPKSETNAARTTSGLNFSNPSNSSHVGSPAQPTATAPRGNQPGAEASDQHQAESPNEIGTRTDAQANAETTAPNGKSAPKASENHKASGASPSATWPTSSDEYYVVPDDFHIIPAVCLLARDNTCANIVCYVKIPGVMQTLALQLQGMTSKPVFVVATPNSAALPGVLNAFDSPNGGIAFCNYLAPLHPQLRTKPIHRIIHAGWACKPDLYTKQVDIMNLVGCHLSLVMTQAEYSSVPDPDSMLGASHLNLTRSVIPSAAFDLVVQQWQAELDKSSEKSLNGCFMEWMLYHGTGPYKNKRWTILELASQANAFAEQVLRRRSDQGGLKVTEGFVRYMKLEPAVKAGILQVKT